MTLAPKVARIASRRNSPISCPTIPPGLARKRDWLHSRSLASLHARSPAKHVTPASKPILILIVSASFLSARIPPKIMMPEQKKNADPPSICNWINPRKAPRGPKRLLRGSVAVELGAKSLRNFIGVKGKSVGL